MLSAAGILPEDIISRHILAVLHLKDLIAIENAACAHHWMLPVRSWISRVRLPKFTVSNRTINTSAQWLSSRNVSVDALALSVEGDLSSLQLSTLSSLCKGAKTISLGSATQLSHIEPILLSGETADKVCSVVVSRNWGAVVTLFVAARCRKIADLHLPDTLDTGTLSAILANLNWIGIRTVKIDELKLHLSAGKVWLQRILQKCSELRHLGMNVLYESDNGLLPLLQELGHLESIDLDAKEHSEWEYGLTDAVCYTLAQYCRNLTQVSLEAIPVTDAGITALCEGCRKLSTLSISTAGLTSAALYGIVRYARQLQELTVPMYIFGKKPEDASGTNMHSHYGGDQTGFLPQLRRLHALQYAFQSNTIALHRIVTVARTVTELRLESCSSRDGSFTDKHIDLIATHCPDLRTLYVQNCYDVTDVGLQALVQKCHALHTWKVERPQCITNSTLFSVATHCAARLQELHLQQWPAITDNGIIPVLQVCRLLHTITVWSCAQLTDATLDALLQYRANNVTHLTVAGCPLLTGEAVVRVGLSCRKLRVF
jgi:hypothetical protein